LGQEVRVPYAIKRRQDNTPPQDAQEIGWRAVAPGTAQQDLEPFEVLVDEVPAVEDPVWDAKAKRPREKTAAERAAR
jgi:hypothetical protein